MNANRRRSAFTLIELVVVLIVVGLLLAVALPNFFGASTSAQDSAARQYLSVSYQELKAAIASNDGQEPSTDVLVAALQSAEPQLGYLSSVALNASTEPNNKLVYVEQTATGYKLGIRSASRALIVLTADRSTGYVPMFGNPVFAPPANISAPVVSGTAAQDSTLSATSGSWLDPSTYSYQWQRCDSAGAACVSIAGATNSTYTIVSTDVGSTLRALVTATGSGGSSSTSVSVQTGVVTSAYPLTVLADSPLAYYHFDETSGPTMTDSSGHGNNGTYGASTTFLQAPAIGGGHSIQVTGASSSPATIPQIVNTVGASTTVEFWLFDNSSAINAQGRAVVKLGGQMLWFYQGYFGVGTVNNDVFGFSDAPLVGAWHLIDAVLVSSQIVNDKFYVDGVLQSVSQVVGGPVSSGLNTALTVAGNAIAMTGKLDELSIYTGALSQARISAHYAAH